ncbi:NAD-dependent epimerase/dehydratase family protein [Cupriavidus alkaliphilus]|uniref:NAD-dependent epimerase/dehydratase family protein n=1 Tax=Cupriavidus alkaliphilus TaxID=942866 RepID=UPI00160C234B|nr:NAD(P)-dependent oxidoreductase [Cupriavidus alkaliphilus]MBB3011443.1 nucleoside-diphosphate-sugar epimerase [Cupriavidus alkaliphilus]
MSKGKRVLVTGAAGYIGSGVCRRLLSEGFDVIGMDSLMYGATGLLPLLVTPRFTFVRLDIRKFERLQEQLNQIRPFAVVHLAAIVGDPACKKMPEVAWQTNLAATKALFGAASENDASRFIFASTCSNYGMSDSVALLSEDNALNPLSLYAETKVEAEHWLIENTATLETYILRFGTAHGLSARMRFDLTVNEFARAIAMDTPFDVYDSETWRPYCHVNDFAELICGICSDTTVRTGANVFNVGSDEENYRKIDLINAIAQAMGRTARFSDTGKGADRRNYRVSFARIVEELKFMPRYGVAYSARQISEALRLGLLPSHEAHYANV